MATRALDVRKSGAVEPGLENGAIRALRHHPQTEWHAALAFLESPGDAEWQAAARLESSDIAPQLIKAAFRGAIDIYYFRNNWYGIPTGSQPFDSVKAQSGLYLRATSRIELERLIQLPRRHYGFLRNLPGAIYRRSRKLAKLLLQAAGFRFGKRFDPTANMPQIVLEGFWNHNVVHFRGTFFGVAQSLGTFWPSKADTGADSPYLRGRTVTEVKKKILARMNITRSRRLRNAIRNLLSHRGAHTNGLSRDRVRATAARKAELSSH
jgi:hypothetical protein